MESVINDLVFKGFGDVEPKNGKRRDGTDYNVPGYFYIQVDYKEGNETKTSKLKVLTSESSRIRSEVSKLADYTRIKVSAKLEWANFTEFTPLVKTVEVIK